MDLCGTRNSGIASDLITAVSAPILRVRDPAPQTQDKSSVENLIDWMLPFQEVVWQAPSEQTHRH